MARYIDADKFSERIRLSPAFKNLGWEGDLLQGVILDLLDNAPTADVVEVKFGKWIKTDRGIRVNANTGQPMRVYYCECSCCGWHTGNQGVEFKYCPQCGTKMDGKEDNK